MLQLLALTIPLASAEVRLPLRAQMVNCAPALERVFERRESMSRQRYKDDLVNLKVTTPLENKEWLASKSSAGSYTFFTVDVMLRDLNVRYKDKELATAIVHHLHQTMDGYVSATVGVLKQSDFKSFRLAVPGPMTPERVNAITAKLHQAVVDVMSELGDRNIVRRTDRLDGLVHVAAGPTADWADLLAKLSRQGGAATPDDAESARQLAVQALDWFARHFGSTTLNDATANVPNRKAFDLIKKFKSPVELASVLNARYPDARVTPVDAVHLYSCLERISVFAAGLHLTERVVVSLEDASEGGASLDFRGMNAANLHVTAKALRLGEDVGDVLRLSRTGERDVTAEFRAKIRALQELGPFICSGDDCIFRGQLSRREKLALLRKLNANPLLKDVRVAFIQPKIRERSERHILATHGEAIETYLRLLLESQIPADVLDQTTFAVDMRTTELNDGTVALMIASSKKLNPRLLREAFAKAVTKQNESLAAESSRPSTYRPL